MRDRRIQTTRQSLLLILLILVAASSWFFFIKKPPSLAKPLQRPVLYMATGYSSHYTGEVLPTPQEAVYFGTDTDLTAATIYIAGKADKVVRAAAQELADRIESLEGKKPHIKDAPLPVHAVLVASGQISLKQAFGNIRSLAGNIPGRKEGYLLQNMTVERNKALIILGHDAAGTYWGSQSLLQLLRRENDRVICRDMKIVDFPAFEMRSFKLGGSYRAIEILGKWCPSMKFNSFNICYTSIGPDKWPDPDQDYRRLVERLADYLLPRGVDVMLFINPYFLWNTHMEISKSSDMEHLLRTSSIGLERGSRRVMLCLDDYASEPQQGPKLFAVRSEADRKKFGDDLAEAHTYLLNAWFKGMKSRFPDCELFVVPSYYWSPGGLYEQEAERYLKQLGEKTPTDLIFVWTGPQIRSTSVTREDVLKFSKLINRKPFLWDNTIYAWHDPPDYFLDLFRTSYPDGFEKLLNKGCHYNAGASEAYRIGLMCIADYLWNPKAYDPEKSLKKAIRISAGNAALKPLLEFRDLYFGLRDRYAEIIRPYSRHAGTETPELSPADASAVMNMQRRFAQGDELIRLIESSCSNRGLAEEAKNRWQQLKSTLSPE